MSVSGRRPFWQPMAARLPTNVAARLSVAPSATEPHLAGGPLTARCPRKSFNGRRPPYFTVSAAPLPARTTVRNCFHAQLSECLHANYGGERLLSRRVRVMAGYCRGSNRPSYPAAVGKSLPAFHTRADVQDNADGRTFSRRKSSEFFFRRDGWSWRNRVPIDQPRSPRAVSLRDAGGEGGAPWSRFYESSQQRYANLPTET